MQNLRSVSNGKVSQWFLSDSEAALVLYMDEVVEHGQLPLFELNILLGIVPTIDPFLDVTGDDDAFEFEWETFPAASPCMLAAATILQEEPRPQIAIDWDQLNATPEAVRFQLNYHTFDCFDEGIAVELARFITNENELGLIKSIQTGMTFGAPGSGDNDYRWPRGEPAYFMRELDTTVGSEVGDCRIEWVLMIEGIGAVKPDPKDYRLNTLITTPSEWISYLPGMVHPEIGPWNRMLFLWGADHYVRLRCPANSLVSLWCYCYPQTPLTGLWMASGMLKGQNQVMESERTYCNITRMD